jgi:AbrB family looped-hinge helix DNA binding protein
MSRNISQVTRKGQVTIPIELRREFGIEEGDKVAFVRQSGAIQLLPLVDKVPQWVDEFPEGLPENSVVRRLAEIVAPYRYAGNPISIEEMKEAAADGWTERERRSLAERDREIKR